MESTKSIQEKINRYLSNQMTEEEVHLFYTEVEQNPDLKIALEESYIAREAVASYQKPTAEELALKDVLIKNSEGKVRRRRIQVMAQAATILLVIVGSIFVVTQHFENPTTAPAVADKFIKPVALDGYLSSSNNDEEAQLWLDILNNYKLSNDSSCATIKQKVAALSVNHKHINKAYLLSGSCTLIHGNPKEAIGILENVSPDASQLRNEAQWYTALGLLKVNDLASIKAAKSILEGLPSKIDKDKEPVTLLKVLEDAGF